MKTRVSMKLVWLFLGLAFTLTLTSAAGAQPGEFVKGVLQPLADGFPKHAITFINQDEAASRDGIFTREMVAAMRPLSPVDLLISDEPSPHFGTWYTIKDILKREGALEGYYPLLYSAGGTTTDLIAEPIERDLGLTLKDVNMITCMETYPYMLFQRKPAPWGATLAGLVKYAKENPGKLKYISLEVGSMNDIVCEYILSVLGVKDFKKIPQGTHGEVAAVVGSGEGDFGLEFGEIIMPHFQNGRADVIFIAGEYLPPPWDKDPNVLSSTAAKKAGFNIPVPFPFFGSRGWTLPKGAPQSHLDWLYKLLKATSETPAFKQHITTVPGLQANLYTPAESNALNQKILDLARPVMNQLKLNWEAKQ